MTLNQNQALARFKLDALRPEQAPIIQAVWSGQDVLAVLPTGAGKSLCYQLPAYEADGVTIVISPLLALMRDQINKLESLGLESFHLSSAQSGEEYEANLARLKSAQQGLLYLSPEQLSKGIIQYWLKSVPLTRLVIDEAHCFSDWGHEFRPDYRRVIDILKLKPDLPISAFTATATRRVVEDLRENLFETREPAIFIQSAKRKNIDIRFVEKEQPRAQLLSFLEDETTVIYAATRSKTEVLSQAIGETGRVVQAYHAGLEPDTRRRIEQEFMAGEIDAIVATNAFGMGVDHPTIRHIIHADLPQNLESYVQEIGRAGRDGRPARATALYGVDDYELRYEQIETSVKRPQRRAYRLALLDVFYEMARSKASWREIERYFEAEIDTPGQAEDDNALNALKRWRYDYAQRHKMRPWWVLPDDVLASIAEKKPTSLDELALVSGIGKTRLERYGVTLLEALGHRVNPMNKKRREIALEHGGDLYERLVDCARALRRGVDGLDKPMDCPSALILRIVETRPQNLTALSRVTGMNEKRIIRFGDAFLLELQTYSD